MTITVEIPEELAGHLLAGGKDPARSTIEAIALEGDRCGQLAESAIRQLLGFETRMEVHQFLKDHQIYLSYTEDDLAHDMDSALAAVRRAG